MKTYNHLSKSEREIIAVLQKVGLSLRKIAQDLGRHHSSLSRELKRNLFQKSYNPLLAHGAARQRLKTSHKHERIQSSRIRKTITKLIKKGWSPEIISGRLQLSHKKHVISHEAIYQWIYKEQRQLAQFFVRHHPKRFPKFASRFKREVPGRVPISQRSPQANSRQEPGHWESDLIVSRQGKAALKVSVERTSRFSKISKVKDKTSAESLKVMSKTFSKIPHKIRKSITYDNGSENFLHHILIHQLGIQSFFAEPHHPWEKPTVENTNGLIRRFFPKRTNFDIISHRDIKKVETWLNNRPRKCLNFKTPREALNVLWCT